MRLLRILFVVLCASLLVPAVLAQGPAPEAAKGEPIRIGAVFAITGPAAWLGEPESKMAQMIVDEVNAKGGINGRPIEIDIKDTQGTPDMAVTKVTELLRSGVVAIVGPSRSDTSMAVADICEEAQIPMVSCAALAQIVEPKPGTIRQWVFKTPHRDDHVVERIFDAMKEKGMKTVAMMSDTTSFGAGGREKLLEQAPKFGIKVVADETYGPQDTDMTAQLTKIKAANPDAVVNWSITPAQSIMMKNMKQLDMKMQLFQSHGFGNINFLKAAGEAAEGVLFPASRVLVVDDLPQDYPNREMLTKLKKDYEDKYKEPMSSFAGYAYDSLMLVLDAIRETDGSPKAIRDNIENRKGFVGTAGVFNFSPTDHTGLQTDSLEMVTVKDGKFVRAGK
jgi:branched-chain amino acid transport system substrate-binding protein